MSRSELYLDEIPMVYPFQRGINEKYPLPGLGENRLFVFDLFSYMTEMISAMVRIVFHGPKLIQNISFVRFSKMHYKNYPIWPTQAHPGPLMPT